MGELTKSKFRDEYTSITPEYIKTAALRDIKICAFNYYNKLHPYEADMHIINEMVKAVMTETGLDERDSAEIVKRRLRWQYRDAVTNGLIEE